MKRKNISTLLLVLGSVIIAGFVIAEMKNGLNAGNAEAQPTGTGGNVLYVGEKNVSTDMNNGGFCGNVLQNVSLKKIRFSAQEIIRKAYYYKTEKFPFKIKIPNIKAKNAILVHDLNFNPIYYIVSIADVGTGRIIARVGINAKNGEWQWYAIERGTVKTFPFVTKNAAQREAYIYMMQKNLSDKLRPPKAISMPDKNIYWVFQAESGKFTIFVDINNITNIFVLEENELQNIRQSIQNHSYDRRESGDTTLSESGEEALGLPISYDISVPYHYQQTSWYCGEAAMEMIFDYYGPDISQYDIGDVANENPSYGTYTNDLRRAAHFSHLSTAIQNSNLHGYRERPIGYGAFENWWSYPDSSDPDYPNRYADLKRFISNDCPTILLTYYDANHYTNHFRVLKGYNDATNEFIVHDPWYSGVYQGPNVHFNQNFLVDNLWTTFYRWGLFVHPWNIVVNTPSNVEAGETFTVTATVKYTCMSPFSGWYISNSKAIINLPSGYNLASGETVEKHLSIGSGGSMDSCSWQVTAPNSVRDDTIKVTATGIVSGSSYSYGSYTDEIGGEGSTVAQITDTTPPKINNVEDNPDPQNVGGWINITCNVEDNAGVNIVKVNITSLSFAVNVTMSNIPGTNIYYYNTTYPLRGTYSYFIWTQDIYNNVNSSKTHTFVINKPPYPPTLNSPLDGKNRISLSPILNVTVTDPDGDIMNVSFYNASNDDLLKTVTNVANNASAIFNWSGLSSGTTYRWYVIVDDGINVTKSDTWTFMTDYKPRISLNSPLNNSMGIEINTLLNVTIVDLDGDTMNVSFYNTLDDSLIGRNNGVLNNSFATCKWVGLSPETTYEWYVVVDDGVVQIKSDLWKFTTFKDVTPPNITNIEVHPSVQMINKWVNISCRITDNVAIDKARINITYPDGSIINESMKKVANDSIYYYNATYGDRGNYFFFIWASDTSGNANASILHNFNIIIPLCDSIDNCNVSISTGGNAKWFGENNDFYYGGDAAQSGDIGDNQKTWLQITVINIKSISFYWKVSSEPGFDPLTFYIDGKKIKSISGEVDWQLKQFDFGLGGIGMHTFNWSFEKDESYSEGEDAGWVDYIRLNHYILVDDDFENDPINLKWNNIQDAIDNASNGDTIFIHNGTYYENVVVNKSISLVGEDKNGVIINGNKSGNVVNIAANWANISGFTIMESGNNWKDAGVKLFNSSNINVSNCNILLNNKGILLANSFNNTMFKCNVSNNPIGIGIDNSNNNNVSNCNILSNDIGVWFLYSLNKQNTIYGCNISNNDAAVSINGSSIKNIISNCDIYSNNELGIGLSASNNKILGCHIVSNNNYGIYALTDNNTISNCDIILNNGWGIYMDSLFNNTISNCDIILNNGWGIYMDSLFNNTISNCDISLNSYGGFYLKNATNINILNTSISQNDGVGFIAVSSSDSTISNCKIYSNKYHGIDLNFSISDFIISNCLISNNTNSGIFMPGSNNTTILNCTISNNNRGLSLLFSGTTNNIIRNCDILGNNYGIFSQFAQSNLIYNNYFDNVINAYDSGNNIWNVSKIPYINIVGGPYLGGNYWSGYIGVDKNDDGIGDMNLPYNLSGSIENGGDYLPLISVPSVVYVDDDYNGSTVGWKYNRFNKIQDGINTVAENGTVYVFNGTYYENIIVNKTVNITGKGIDIIIDGNGRKNVIYITANGVNISGFEIQNSGYQRWAHYAGISIHSKSNTISNNIFSNNRHGIYILIIMASAIA